MEIRTIRGEMVGNRGSGVIWYAVHIVEIGLTICNERGLAHIFSPHRNLNLRSGNSMIKYILGSSQISILKRSGELLPFSLSSQHTNNSSHVTGAEYSSSKEAENVLSPSEQHVYSSLN